MPDWYTITSTAGTFLSAIDLGARSTANVYHIVQGETAKALLDKIDDILRDSHELLKSNKQLIPEGEYPDLRRKHRR
jgi:hypothetical protein